MRIISIVILLSISGCNSLKHEFEWMQQRADIKKSKDYLTWKQAKPMIEQQCSEVKSIYQGHSKIVSVAFVDGVHIESISHYLDEILEITDSCLPSDAVILME